MATKLRKNAFAWSVTKWERQQNGALSVNTARGGQGDTKEDRGGSNRRDRAGKLRMNCRLDELQEGH